MTDEAKHEHDVAPSTPATRHQRRTKWLAILVLTIPLVILAVAVLKAVTSAPENHERVRRDVEVVFENPEAQGHKDRIHRKVKNVAHWDNEVIYDAVYTIDGVGRRVTPVSRPDSRDRFLLFFGGSFVYGQGVAQDETLPFYAGELAPAYRPYNYGRSGDGTQHLLERLKAGNLPEQVEEKHGYGIYVYMPYHMGRLIGSMPDFNLFTEDFPYYYLDEDGELVRDGTFRTGRPWRSAVYDALWSWPVLEWLPINLPAVPAWRKDIDLFMAVIRESRRLFQAQFPGSEFVVLFYYFPGQEPARWNATIQERLEAEGIPYVDACSWLTLETQPAYVLPDSHPKPNLNRRVADILVQELGIAAGTATAGSRRTEENHDARNGAAIPSP